MATVTDLQRLYADKHILVFGLGIQGGGIETASFFAQLGAQVRVTDLKSPQDLQSALAILKKYPRIDYTLGKHIPDDILWADVVIQNPGVKSSHPMIQLAMQHHKEVTMEIALFMKYNPSITVGITGTRGKSTVTHMIYEVLKKYSDKKVYLAGNVPQKAAIGLLKKVTAADITVLELSSYQLHSFSAYKISPSIAVFTNFYPDHLNYYPTMDEYLEDKMNIFRYQKKDQQVVISQQALSLPIVEKAICSTIIKSSREDFTGHLVHLHGNHNYENAALALHVAQLFGIPHDKAIKIIANFKGLPFRQEYLGTIQKIPFYNDSTSTTPIACSTALSTVKQLQPHKTITLVLGGNSKNLPFNDLVHTINQTTDTVYLLKGTMTDEMRAQLRVPHLYKTIFDSLPELLSVLVPALDPNTVVLFSPAATSFATFKNEFDRGEKFTAAFLAAQKTYGT